MTPDWREGFLVGGGCITALVLLWGFVLHWRAERLRKRVAAKQGAIGYPTKHSSSCLQKSADDEPIFVLCGRDPAAPETIAMWRSFAERKGVPNSKLISALEVQHRMIEWQGDNRHRMRTPS